ncbi:hypothetical protein ASPBRDRAFT_31385 [Aspergillus brasiliensis CBS 101740]|uniref:Uncharacterized protein n=1 Tax=Aspergillus brasiliensis (strain CBS 101740 / IMI 381727 / IBT 21946) TaxID=767769 RepID=A0A1L9UFN9_ASPBC|nr:hypothetical protein ASPBRDRAFT_31385 [Aspergillus brasiliensis CBS 101740]
MYYLPIWPSTSDAIPSDSEIIQEHPNSNYNIISIYTGHGSYDGEPRSKVACFGVEASATPSQQPPIPIKADCRDKGSGRFRTAHSCPEDGCDTLKKPRITSHGYHPVRRNPPDHNQPGLW